MDFLSDSLPSWALAIKLDNPVNFALLIALAYLLLPFFMTPDPSLPAKLPTAPTNTYNWRPASHPALEAIVWKQWKPKELRGYDGVGQERILFAIRRKVYDVTAGRSFYGPGGPYAIFAGRDASRGLAKHSFEPEMLTPVDEPIDDLADLTSAEWDSLKEWESHFANKYTMCGDYLEAS